MKPPTRSSDRSARRSKRRVFRSATFDTMDVSSIRVHRPQSSNLYKASEFSHLSPHQGLSSVSEQDDFSFNPLVERPHTVHQDRQSNAWSTKSITHHSPVVPRIPPPLHDFRQDRFPEPTDNHGSGTDISSFAVPIPIDSLDKVFVVVVFLVIRIVRLFDKESLLGKE